MYPRYDHHGRMMTGFDGPIERSTFGHWSNPEYQQLEQDHETQCRFNDWFHGNEIRGDFELACNTVGNIDPKKSDINDLFEAFIKYRP